MTKPKSGGIKVKTQVVPVEFGEYLRGVSRLVSSDDLNALLAASHDAGWTFTALGTVLDITHEAVRKRCARGDAARCPADRIPVPPRWPPSRIPRRDVPEKIAVRLRELRVQSQHVNRSTPADDPGRLAGQLLARMLADLLDDDYSLNSLARATDVTHAAIGHRLARHGYRPQYASVKTDVLEPRIRCRSGLHLLTGDNVIERSHRGGMMRLCRACIKARRAESRKRGNAG